MAMIKTGKSWDRRSRGSFVDPSVSHDALVQADRQAGRGRSTYAGMPATDFLPLGRDFSQANRSGTPGV